MKHLTKCIVLFCFAGIVMPACSYAPAPTAASEIWPTEGWLTATPDEQGIDSQKLEQMRAVIQEKDINIHGFLIVRNGYLVSETYFDSYDQDKKHDLQSAARSITATLIGITIDKGYNVWRFISTRQS